MGSSVRPSRTLRAADIQAGQELMLWVACGSCVTGRVAAYVIHLGVGSRMGTSQRLRGLDLLGCRSVKVWRADSRVGILRQ